MRSRFLHWGVRHRFILAALLDGGLLAVALVFAVLLRFEFDPSRPSWWEIAAFVPVVVIVQVLFGLLEGIYVGGFRFGSFDEVAGVTRSVVATTLLTALLNRFVLERLVPVSVSIAYGFTGLVLLLGVRYLWRLSLERSRRPDSAVARKVLVFGAGEGGAQIITAMLRNPLSPFLPVGLLDDAPHKAQLRISGVPVMGRLDRLVAAANRTGADALVIAVPSAGSEVVRAAARLAGEAGLETLILPPVAELLTDRVGISDIRPVTEEDLLGRHRVETDINAIAGYLTNKRVLVTGAGGSIGSELCRQIDRFGPAALIMLDRDESALHAVQLSIDGRGQLDSRTLVIADIRDPERLGEVFLEWRPHVVFHAAALKHVPLLEMYPEEALKTNVWGTQHLLVSARDHDVERFVNISTDKAADPINVLGKTKRIAECLTAHMAQQTSGTYMSVRFGNVLGSRGSVLTAFHSQIDAGGPVTVTDPDVSRFFMTVEEAVELVIQAGAIGQDGEALVLDMGEPVRIAEVAERMVEAAARPIEIVYTGLRPGEKMHEVLFGTGEKGSTHQHPSISHVPVPPIGIDSVDLDEVRSGAVGFEGGSGVGATER